jgi:hypothetical protein
MVVHAGDVNVIVYLEKLYVPSNCLPRCKFTCLNTNALDDNKFGKPETTIVFVNVEFHELAEVIIEFENV